MHVRLKDTHSASVARETIEAQGGSELAAVVRLLGSLAGGRTLSVLETEGRDEALAFAARSGLVVFFDERAGDATTLVPSRWDFNPRSQPPAIPGLYKFTRLAYTHVESGALCLRHPASDCFVRSEDPATMAVLGAFMKPADVAALDRTPSAGKAVAICVLLIRAGILQPCDDDGRTLDESHPERRQWELHDAIFHSRSRLGRTEQRVGATWAFKGELSQAPATKVHSWTQHVIELPHVDLATLQRMDMSLAEAMETRRSVRFNGLVPLTALELGAFLYRVFRIRYRYTDADSVFTSRPYPGGGALYEGEIYVTIDRCADLPRGFYYYDAERHALCLISIPDRNSEALLEEARMATVGICRPQILLTVASRHTRVSWKYSGMAYATQLKNVGVIYQTMYLVATAMNLGGCALGFGNTDRFLAMTGLDWFEEGSVGEFILGRPL